MPHLYLYLYLYHIVLLLLRGSGPTVFCTLFVAYSLGYGAVVSVMPMLTRRDLH